MRQLKLKMEFGNGGFPLTSNWYPSPLEARSGPGTKMFGAPLAGNGNKN